MRYPDRLNDATASDLRMIGVRDVLASDAIQDDNVAAYLLYALLAGKKYDDFVSLFLCIPLHIFMICS